MNLHLVNCGAKLGLFRGLADEMLALFGPRGTLSFDF